MLGDLDFDLEPRGSNKMKGSSSTPFLMRVSNSFLSLKQPLLVRASSTSDKLYSGDMADSPLFDLAPVALPGLGSRVSRNNSVALSLDDLGAAFEREVDPDQIVQLEGGVTPALLSSAALGVICAWNYGFMAGSMNTASPAMRAALGIASEAAADDVAWGLCVSIFCLGALLGCAAAATLANGLGRRRALLATSAACTIGAALEASSCLFPCDAIVPGQCTASAGLLLMLVGRVVAGMASGATTVVTPIYLGELAPPHLRGAFGVMFQLACVAALLCAQVLGLPSLLGTSTLWPLYIFGGVGFPSAVQYVLQGRLLESPQWLVGRSGIDAQEAERVLCILRGVSEEDFGPLRDAVIKELDYMQLSVMQSAASGSGRSSDVDDGFYGLLRNTDLRASVRITVMCAMVQQFSGINNAFNFSSTFLSANGIGAETVTLIAVLMNVGNVLITILSGWLMDRAGRKPLLLGSTIGMAVSIGCLSFALTHPGREWTAGCAIFSVVMFVCSFGVGMGPVPWLLPVRRQARTHARTRTHTHTRTRTHTHAHERTCTYARKARTPRHPSIIACHALCSPRHANSPRTGRALPRRQGRLRLRLRRRMQLARQLCVRSALPPARLGPGRAVFLALCGGPRAVCHLRLLERARDARQVGPADPRRAHYQVASSQPARRAALVWPLMCGCGPDDWQVTVLAAWRPKRAALSATHSTHHFGNYEGRVNLLDLRTGLSRYGAGGTREACAQGRFLQGHDSS